MQRVDGIGGVFLYANDPAALAAWYTDTLGIEFHRNESCDNFYVVFEQRDAADPSRSAHAVFSLMKAEAPLSAERRECRVNFRVRDLAAIVAQLASKHVSVSKTEEYDYGLFAWITDPEGYSIELYQPR